jgi:hypothetical protein
METLTRGAHFAATVRQRALTSNKPALYESDSSVLIGHGFCQIGLSEEAPRTIAFGDEEQSIRTEQILICTQEILSGFCHSSHSRSRSMASRNTFDFTFIAKIALVVLFSGLAVVSNPNLSPAIFVLNAWLLGYHHVVSTYTRLAFDKEFCRAPLPDYVPAVNSLAVVATACILLTSNQKLRTRVIVAALKNLTLLKLSQRYSL